MKTLKSPPENQVIKPVDGFGRLAKSQTGLAVEPTKLPVTGDVKINLP